jgi:hypothetical protein
MRLAIIDAEPAEMGPKEVHQWGMRIGLIIGVDMVDAMDCYPASWGVFKAANAENREAAFNP